jgi:hypothetical protein
VGSSPAELVIAAGIILVLLGLAGHFARRQWQTLRSLRDQPDLSPEDRSYYRSQTWRRLTGCLLMVAFAGMLAGWYVLGLSQQAENLRRQGEEQAAQADPPGKLDKEQQRSVNVFSTYWIIATLLLMAMIVLACTDFWAIRRYGLRHLRRIQSDRRAALEKDIALYRSRRNGHG